MSFYGFVYILGFLMTFLPLGKYDFYQNKLDYKIFISIYAAIGAIIGGRIGYALIYEPNYYYHHLREIIEVYKGGMSFHGGLIGVVISLLLCEKQGFWKNLDKISLIAILIIPLGRIANFCNGELWGTPTDAPWGVVFSGADPIPRHPVQIYEAILEGPVMALSIYLAIKILEHFKLFKNIANPGSISCLYGTLYGLFRTFTEFFREPDKVVGMLPLHLTLGQYLSIILFIISFGCLSYITLINCKKE